MSIVSIAKSKAGSAAVTHELGEVIREIQHLYECSADESVQDMCKQIAHQVNKRHRLWLWRAGLSSRIANSAMRLRGQEDDNWAKQAWKSFRPNDD